MIPRMPRMCHSLTGVPSIHRMVHSSLAVIIPPRFTEMARTTYGFLYHRTTGSPSFACRHCFLNLGSFAGNLYHEQLGLPHDQMENQPLTHLTKTRTGHAQKTRSAIDMMQTMISFSLEGGAMAHMAGISNRSTTATMNHSRTRSWLLFELIHMLNRWPLR